MAAPKKQLPTIKACLFDMDGLLIDSEDKYTICTNEVLNEYGRPNLPWHIKAQLQGRPGPTAGKILFDWAQLPISREEYLAKVSARQKHHFTSCQPLPGVPTLLQTLKHRTSPPVHIALATSSHSGNFKLKTDHLQDLFQVFDEENRVLGDDKRIPPGRGKPAPDIWLVALETINKKLEREGKEKIRPEECLVFEDSVPGTESARRAGMQVVWCPHEGLLNEYKGREDLVLAGLMGEYKEVGDDVLGKVEGGDKEGQVKKTASPPGEVGDGWARLVKTLEDFPYAEYGIGVKEEEKL
ncbi:unnamed protein product [Cercospora beticola]|nr:unnamed protein product [Cercospora beticola]